MRRILDEERYLVECEKSYFKLRLEMQDDGDEVEDPGGGETETEEEKKERERIEKAIEIAGIEANTVFNEEDMTLDYGRKRATDCKHNTCVKLRLKKEFSTGGWHGGGSTGSLGTSTQTRRVSRRVT